MHGAWPDAGEADKGDGGSVEVFVVLGEAAATVDPGDPLHAIPSGSLDDPTSGDDLEALGLGGALDQLDPPSGIGHGPAQFFGVAINR